VRLFRVFDWNGSAVGRTAGGPLWVSRARQGSGRHDAPAKYGAWYCSREAVSAIAECIQYLRGHVLSDADFARVGGTTKAIVDLSVDDGVDIVNLDDPLQLVRRRLRPSQVATMRRSVTQKIAASVFDEGPAGIEWWSTLEAEWSNVTLFHERALSHVAIESPPRRLSVRLPEVQQAAQYLAIRT
jgi:hypothetical protein